MRGDIIRALVMAVAFGLPACEADGEEEPMADAGARSAAGEPDAGRGLVFELHEATATVAGADERAPVAAGEALAPERVRALLARLPAEAATEAEIDDFAWPAATLPPPRAGETIETPFPPPAEKPTPDTDAAGPLAVVRHQPEGDVPVAPHLSITFSQPMVAVTGHDDARGDGVPVQIEPRPPGKWRWVGTKTALFEPEGRFPQATEYTVEVPAGTRSAVGGALAEAVRWSFRTPPPRLAASWPGDGPQPLDVPMFAAFDQRIDPERVLARVQVTGGRSVRRLSDEEVERHETLRRLAERAGEGRWVAFRADAPFPPDTAITVTFPAGTPSAEGPRVTTEAQAFTFRTYGPFRVESDGWWRKREYRPLEPLRVTFTNPVDAETFRASRVRVEPEIPGGFEAEAEGRTVILRGRTRGRTTYAVTFDAALRDTFGQTLGEDTTVHLKVGPARPTLFAPGGPLVVLDPAAGGRFPVYSINHPRLRVRLHAVAPEDWEAFRTSRQQRGGEEAPLPGRAVLDRVVETGSAPDTLTETAIDLAPALREGRGQVVLAVEPADPPPKPWMRQTVRVWIQATAIGLDALVDGEQMVAWATALRTGEPLAGVEVSLLPGGPSARTGDDGLATLALPAGDGAGVLVARRGDDVALLPEETSAWGNGRGWRRRPPEDALRWFVFDDRHLYRPGERVRVKGWIRRVGGGPAGDIGALAGAAETVEWTLADARRNEVARGVAAIDALGGFDLAIDLPREMNLGPARLALEAKGGGGVPADRAHHHPIEVQEFRRPEFEVDAQTISEGPHLVGGEAVVAVTAKYYAGGALPGAPARWRVTTSPGHFSPPGRSEFTFGVHRPWWLHWIHGSDAERETRTFEGRTGPDGAHRLRLTFAAAEPPRPFHVSAEAGVEDVNRQTWSASTGLLVHPAALYAGLRPHAAFAREGEPLRLDLIVADIDGAAVAGRPVEIEAARLKWTRADGRWTTQAAERRRLTVTSGAEPVPFAIEDVAGGTWRLRATVRDDAGRANLTELTLLVAGGDAPGAQPVRADRVTLVRDRDAYRGGDVAEVLVQAPFSPAEGLLTLARSGIVRTTRFSMDGPTHTLRIPVEAAWVPNVQVRVDLVGAAPREAGGHPVDAPPRPAFASGTTTLPIPPRDRALTVEAAPRERAVAPGARTAVDLRVTGADGRPVSGAQVAVVVVDEAVLALTGYRVPDPLDVFYRRRDGGVRDHHGRADLLLVDPRDLLERAGGQLEEAEGAMLHRLGAPPPVMRPPMPAPAMAPPEPEPGGGEAAPIAVRKDFDALAVFAPAVPTDAEGRATVEVHLPDNLTRYRVTAVAVAGERAFGHAEDTLTARLPLMIRPSAPRFLNFGDRFELPVVLQNQTDDALAVEVAVRAANLELTGDAGRRVTVPAGDRVEVRFPAATASAGTARFAVAAAAGPWADAAQGEVPVYTPATAEAFATYGELDAGAVRQPVRAPADAIPAFGELEITTSSTALQALTDAVLYLTSYPYECSEQLASRVLAVAALKDVLAAFEAEGLPPPEDLVAAVDRDLARLKGLQNPDGGFDYWRRGEPSVPYVSVHVAHALARAAEKGFAVDEGTLRRAKAYLRSLEDRIPADYPVEARRAILAYGLQVRARLGDGDPARARRLLDEATPDGLSLEASGWLLGALAAEGAPADPAITAVRRHLDNRVAETAATAHFVTRYSGDAGSRLLLHSSRRTDAVILESLIAAAPDSDLIPKLVRGLLAHRERGRWLNTQENVFVLLALDRYFATFERATPDSVARVWLGDRFAGEHAFRGRTTERHALAIPMRHLAALDPAAALTLQKTGPGRLYYRIGLRYAPRDLTLAPADHGFTVERTYEPVDDPADVRRDPDGTWRVRAGATVRVRLTMVAPARRYHVALVDPLPAGLEALNPALAVTGTVDPDPTRPPIWRWHWTWYRHQNLRDDRAEAFTPLLWPGVHTYTYTARATTPGTFVVPPPRAEEMYMPETFGRGATARVVVE